MLPAQSSSLLGQVASVLHMASKNPVVSVKQGQLCGLVETGIYGGKFVSFRGVPYAKPPVGPLRFKDPLPPEPWTGVRDATEFGGIAAQRDLFTHQLIGDDDCLYLNVYVPSLDKLSKRPVMVWIHGGAFIHGSGDNTIFGPDFLVRKDIVLVTINYRLGALGFLNLEHETSPGNQGLKDQVMALKWIQENISNFGGDPSNVTIFGESAGGAAVNYLTISPMAQGLFHKAISQSGVALNPWAHVIKNPSKYAYQLAARLGKETNDPETVVEFLRTVEPLKIVSAENELLKDDQILLSRFGPGIDDKSPTPFMPKHPKVMLQGGVKVPYLLGYNTNEASVLIGFKGPSFYDNIPKINANFNKVLHAEQLDDLKRDDISAMDLKRIYFGDKNFTRDTLQQYSDYINDMMFVQGIFDVVKTQIQNGAQDTYLYKFTYDAPDSLARMKFNVTLPGATHGDDLLYLFYPHIMKQFNLDPPRLGSEKYKVMQYLTQMWTDFAKTGNPTPKPTDTIDTVWEPVQKGDVYDYLNIGKTLKMETTKKDEQTFEWKRMKNKL